VTIYISSATVWKFREHEPPGDLRACPGMYMDFFPCLVTTFQTERSGVQIPIEAKNSLRRADRRRVQWLEMFLPRK
jgi:hypothetical protein